MTNKPCSECGGFCGCQPNEMFYAIIGEMRGGLIKITTDRDCLSPDLIRFDERVFANEMDMLNCAMSYRNRGYNVCVDIENIFQDYYQPEELVARGQVLPVAEEL